MELIQIKNDRNWLPASLVKEALEEISDKSLLNLAETQGGGDL